MPLPNSYIIQSYLHDNTAITTNAAPYYSITVTPVTPPHIMPIIIDPKIFLLIHSLIA